MLPLLFALLVFTACYARAALQFDVFPGYDSIVPEATWFPIVCEIKNDGAAFTGVIEVSAGQLNGGQTRRVVVELPTGTLKRLVIPVFSTARYQSSWDVRLLDERNRTRAEQLGIRPRRQTAANTVLLGALPRTATGLPTFRPASTGNGVNSESEPAAARLQSALLPDNPLVYEGLDAIYLNSEKALELEGPQVAALLAWLNAGGHLIVGVESIADVNGTSWLRKLVPCDLTDMRTVASHPELQDWLQQPASGSAARARDRIAGRNPGAAVANSPEVAKDSGFESAELQVATGTLREGATTLISSSGIPLVINSHEGRGRITALLFSPERKPISNWRNLPAFWSRLAEVPPVIYANNGMNNGLSGGWSIDGVFGAMIDSKQVRKLPVEWLLLLLIVYLVVIGPLDQYWLKSIKRPMLTWITFPCYVVLFSLLIYFIGYKLRAGETEWNELHLVDVLANGSGAELRGRTYASIYSPVNASYRVESQEHYSVFRGEFQSAWAGGGQDGERADVLQYGDNFKAQISVPVWTSQLYVSDWWQSMPEQQPLSFKITSDSSDWSVSVTNWRDHPLTNARLAVGDRFIALGDLPARQTKTFKLPRNQGELLRDFVQSRAGGFQNASQSRQQAFGSSGSGRILDLPNSSMAVSFISNLSQERFISPPGLDLSPLLDQGNAVLLAWEDGYSPVKPLNQFAARRGHKDTLWRVSVPINAP